MEIVDLLPPEIQNKIKYFVLEHPISRLIKDKIKELRCDEYYVFRDKNKKIFCKIDGRSMFISEYFSKYKTKKHNYEYDSDDDSSSSVDNDLFHTMFDVSSTSDDDE